LTQITKQFAIADPNTFDGDPFEVADRALRQSAAVAEVLAQTLKGARIMARNAEMERQLLATDECSAAEFEESAQARLIDGVIRDVASATAMLEKLAQAASYNPRKPPRLNA
jgi:hypothetical protein